MVRALNPWRRMRRLVDDRRGVSALEFAIGGAAFLMAMVAVMELGMVMFLSSSLEGGLREASRFGLTGYTPPGTTREQAIQDIVAENTYGLVDPATLQISYKVYPNFESIGQSEPFDDTSPANGTYDPGESFQDINGNGQWDADMGTVGLGGPGDIVVYTVRFDWRLMTPLFEPFIDGGTLPIEASVAVRNEPYDPTGGA